MLLKNLISKLQEIYDKHNHEDDPYPLIFIDKFRKEEEGSNKFIYCGLDPNINIEYSTLGYVIDSFDIAKEMKKMPNLYMLVGLPGSGKSFWISHSFVPKNRYHIASTDHYIDHIASHFRISYNEAFDAIKFAEKMMYKDLNTAIKNNFDIIWDQTNLTKKSRADKLKNIPDTYTKYCVNFLLPEIQEWNHRLNNRPGKTIPRHIIESMKKNYEEPTIDEGFVNITTVGSDSGYISQLEKSVG